MLIKPEIVPSLFIKQCITSGKDNDDALLLFLHIVASVKVDDMHSYDWMCNVQIRFQFISTMYR